MKTISIIICCHNSEKRIVSALGSVFCQSDVTDPVQVVLVDNNCSDNTVQEAKNLAQQLGKSLVVVHEPKPGLIYARRAGAFAAEGDYVCFVDDDNLLDPYYIARATSIFACYPDVGYIGGQTRLPAHYTTPEWLTRDLLLSYAVGRQYSDIGRLGSSSPLLWGAGLCVRTKALRMALQNIDEFKCVGRVGGKQLAGDDSELCYRLALQGWAGYHDETLSLVHAIDPDRFTEKRLLEMHKGFGAAKPILDALEATLATKTSRKTKVSRNVLYHPLGRVAAYAVLTALWSLRFSGKIAIKVKVAYYRAALRSSILLLRSCH